MSLQTDFSSEKPYFLVVTQFFGQKGGGMQVSNMLLYSFLQSHYKTDLLHLSSNPNVRSIFRRLSRFVSTSIFMKTIYMFFLLIFCRLKNINMIALDDGILRASGILPRLASQVILVNSGSLATRSSVTILGRLSIFLARRSLPYLRAHFVSDFCYQQLDDLSLTKQSTFTLGRPCGTHISSQPREFPSDHKIYFISYGRLEEDKNFIALIEAFSNLKHPQYQPILHIYGDGRQKALIRKLCNTSNNIEYKGSFRHSELPSILERYHFFALFSTNPNETFGRSWMECSLHGIPPLGSQICNLRFLIKHGFNGFSSELTDPSSILDILSQAISLTPSQYQQLSANALEHSKQYSNQKLSYRLISIIDAIIHTNYYSSS